MGVVQNATQDDIIEAAMLGQVMASEGAFAGISYDVRKASEHMALRILSPDGFAQVARQDGKIVGMMVGHIGEYFFSHEKLARDDVWYVHPEYRKGIIGVRLLKNFVAWGFERGAREICVGISTGTNLGSTGRLLEKLDFVHVGGIYKKGAHSVRRRRPGD